MPAMAIVPMATTVAGDDPERAANIIQASTEAIAKPPLKCPTDAIATRIIRLATSPFDMKVEAKIKNGIARSVYFCPEENNDRATEDIESVEKNAMINTLERPKDTAIGTPKNNNVSTSANKINEIT